MRARAAFALAGIAGALLTPRSVAAASPEDLAAVAWMAGSWQGSAGGTDTEEVWLPPKGGVMLGMHRDVAQGRMVSFEFLRIEADAEGLVLLASPQGKAVTAFRLLSSTKTRVVFSNPIHDFPQRVIYWLGEDERLHARIEGSQGGKPASTEWAWSRVK